MTFQASLAQLFSICVLSAAVEAVAGEDAPGVRTVCGVAIMLTAVRLALGILG